MFNWLRSSKTTQPTKPVDTSVNTSDTSSDNANIKTPNDDDNDDDDNNFGVEGQQQEEQGTEGQEEQGTEGQEEPDNPLRILFVTHQNRIRVSVIAPLLALMKRSFPTNKFSNCSILELTITKTTNDTCRVKLDLIYSGDSTKNKPGKQYWIANNTTQYTLQSYFETLNATVSIADLNKNFYIQPNIFQKYPKVVCYFLRHGKSQHNPSKTTALLSKFSFKTDKPITIFQENTELLADGIKQAQQAGNFFGEYLTYPQKIDVLGVSDLYRTQQTASVFLTAYFNKKYRSETTNLYSSEMNELEPLVQKLFVIPCLHELDEKSQNDNNTNNNNMFMNRENNTTCLDDVNVYANAIQKKSNCKYIYIYNNKYTLNWQLYKKLYGEGTYRNTSKGNNKCMGKNFIGIFLNYFLNYFLNGFNPNSRDRTNDNIINPQQYSDDEIRNSVMTDSDMGYSNVSDVRRGSVEGKEEGNTLIITGGKTKRKTTKRKRKTTKRKRKTTKRKRKSTKRKTRKHYN
jgi:broad specificity phosphatase PhoE